MGLKKFNLLALAVAMCAGTASASVAAFAEEPAEEAKTSTLYVNGSYVGTGEVPEETAICLMDSNGNVLETKMLNSTAVHGMQVEFTDLAEGDYTVEQIGCPDGYSTAATWGINGAYEYSSADSTFATLRLQDGQDYRVTFINTYTAPTVEVEKTSVTVSAVWSGEGDWPDELGSVTIDLLKKDYTGAILGYAAKVGLNESNNRTYTIEGLDATDTNGNPYTYEVVTSEMNNYVLETTGDAENGYVVACREKTHAEQITSVNVMVNWVGDSQSTASVYLLANGEPQQCAELKDYGRGLSHTFMALPVYDENDEKIEYSVKPVIPAGYTAEVSGNITRGFVITYTQTGDTDDAAKTTEAVVDATALKGSGKTVKISLVADGVIKGVTKLSDDAGWTYTFSDLPVTSETDPEHEITYGILAVDEDNGTTYDLYVTNETYFEIKAPKANDTEVETVKIPVTVAWKDGTAKSATLRVYAGDKEVKAATITADDKWMVTFTDLPKYDADGKEITYTVKEDAIDGYVTGQKKNDDGSYVFTNTKKAAAVVDDAKKKDDTVKKDDNTSDTTKTTNAFKTTTTDTKKDSAKSTESYSSPKTGVGAGKFVGYSALLFGSLAVLGIVFIKKTKAASEN